MKKAVCVMLAITMLICNSVSAFALDKEISTIGAVKFEEYMNTLAPDRAAVIRADKELVYTMTRDAYWLPQKAPMSRASVSLPLTGNYAPGKFFNRKNPSSQCTCHPDCGLPPVNGGCSLGTEAGDCKAYNGAIQCKGFADFVFHEYAGVDISISNKVSDDLIPSVFVDSAVGRPEMLEFMRPLPKGTNVRLKNRSTQYGPYHSIIILSSSSKDITFYDCNGTNKPCEIRTKTMDWSTFIKTYSGVVDAWEP